MSRLRLLSLFFLAGAFSQVAQAVMGREMLVVFYGNEICLGLFFASWLCWIALGAWGAGRFSDRLKAPDALFWSLLAWLPVAAAGGIMLLRVCRRFIDVSPSQFVPLEQLAFWSLLVTLPVGLLVGAVFPLACRALGKEEEVSGVYIWDALGGLAGGAIFTFLLVDRLPLWRTLGLLTGVLGLMLIPLSGEKGGGLRARRVVGGTWAALGLLLLLSPLGRMLTGYADRLRWGTLLPGLELVETFDTPYQNIAIARLGPQTSVVADGRVAASFPEDVVPAMEAALLYAQNPKAKRILLVEGATGGLIPEFLKYPVESIVTLESDEKAFRRIEPYLPRKWQESIWQASIKDKRVYVEFGDPRRYFNRFGGTQARSFSYDIIVSLVPDPSTAHLNRLYTKEYFERAKALLSPGGVFVARLTSSENYIGDIVKSYNASVYATMAGVFEDVRVTPGDTNYLLASNASGVLTLDYRKLAKRYKGIRISGRSFAPAAFRSLVPPHRVRFIEKTLRDAKGEINSDLRPVTYYLNMLLWGSFSGSEFVGALELVRRAGGWFVLLPLLIFIAARLGYGIRETDEGLETRIAAVLATCAIGFLAMALEMILIFVFQSFHGHIYQKIGLLNGLFMFGLAIGAFAVAKAGCSKSKSPGIWAIDVAILATIYALTLPLLLQGMGSGDETGFWGLVVASGLIAGAGFPPAVRLYNLSLGKVGRSSGTIDSADHFGGMIGALLTGACLVPLFGVERSCRLAGAVVMTACLPLALLELKRLPAVRSLGRRLGGLPGLDLQGRSEPSFPYKRTSWVLLAVVVTVWGMSALAERHGAPPTLEFSEAELAEVSGLSRFRFRGKPFPHYEAFDDGGRKAGLCFSTLPLAPDISGYSGPMHLLMGLSREGRVLGLKVVEHRETPAYTAGLHEWIRKFKGLDAAAGIRVGREVDGLSGATVTSEAVAHIVSRAAERARERLLGLEHRGASAAGSRASPVLSARFLVIAAFLALFFPVFLAGGERTRLAYLGGAVVVMGFAFNTLFSLIDVGRLSEGIVPGQGNAVWYLIGGFVLLTSLLWGRAYCGYVCPFGALQELLWEVGKPLGLKSHVTAWLDRDMRYAKYLILTGALCLYWVLGRDVWITFNPMQHLFSLRSEGAMVVLIVIVLIGASAYFRFWCRYFCPTGAFLSLFNKLAVARAWAPQRVFALCGQGLRGEYEPDCMWCKRCVDHPAHDRVSGASRKGGKGS